MRMKKPVTAAIGTITLVSALTGCTGDGSNDAEPTEAVRSTLTESGSTLLVQAAGNMTLMASISGELQLNERGCFEVRDVLLVVGTEARVLDGGQGIWIKGVGDIEIGGQVDVSGGYRELDQLPELERWQECAAGSASTEYVLLTPET
ncbi:MAG: hypothetical protein H0X12_13550 [Nocardioides sp.]|nr:hypothetical protein [Nocardioides sp.]